MQLIRGQKLKLADVSSSKQFLIDVKIQSTFVVDVALLGLTNQSKLVNDDYMVFYNQPISPCQSLKLTQNTSNFCQFSLDLARLPNNIQKLVVTLTIDGNDVMNNLGNSSVNITSLQGQMLATFNLNGAMFAQERAIMAFEIYQKDNIWRINAVGQGFNGGLLALIEYFGGEVAKENLTPPSPPPTPKSTVNLSKVTLTKTNSSVNLKKKDEFGKISINLNWNRGGIVKGFFGASNIDLDLGAFIALKDGGIHCIQAVGKHFGYFDSYPYLRLRNDDRTGQSKDGEWLDVNGKHWDKIQEVLVYAFIYSGVPNWQKTDGIVTLHIKDQPPIETHLTEGSNHLNMCAIARLVNDNGNIKVERINRYFGSHQEMDNAFGWGFSWVRGSK